MRLRAKETEQERKSRVGIGVTARNNLGVAPTLGTGILVENVKHVEKTQTLKA